MKWPWVRGDAEALADAIDALYGAIWRDPEGAPVFRAFADRAGAGERLPDPARLSAMATGGLWAALDWVGVDREAYERAIVEVLG